MTPRAPEHLPPPRPELPRDASAHSKASIPPSESHSNEADDEQSFSDDMSAMDSLRSPPHYEGEDTRLTSDKELSGFYMYGWAAEVRWSNSAAAAAAAANEFPTLTSLGIRRMRHR